MNILVFGQGGFVAGDLCELPLPGECLNPHMHTVSLGKTLQAQFSAAKQRLKVKYDDDNWMKMIGEYALKLFQHTLTH